MTAPDRRHTASSVVQIALLFGLPASLSGVACVSSFPGLPSPQWATGSPCGPCGGRTSGSTCASRSGPASCAVTCWSGNCAACSLRKPASPQCGHLREPSVLLVANASLQEKTPGRGARLREG